MSVIEIPDEVPDDALPDEVPKSWDDVRDAWEAGGSLRECGALIGVSYEAVRRRAESEGWERIGIAANESAEQRRLRTAAATDAASLKWAERRSDEADAAGVTAAVARQKIVTALAADDYHMVRAAVGAYMVLIDRAQLLSGGSTANVTVDTQALEQKIARVGKMRDELSGRREQKSA